MTTATTSAKFTRTTELPSASATGAQPRLLLIDDEVRILRSLQALFRGKYEVVTTTDGREALKLLSRQRFNVVVSDQRMPEIQGIDLLRRAKEISPNTTRILLTGFADLAAIVGAVNEGEVFRYVNKPWDNGNLREIVDEASEVARTLFEASTDTLDFVVPITASETVLVPGLLPKDEVLIVDQHDQISALLHSNDLATLGLSHVIYLTANSTEQALTLLETHKVVCLIVNADRASPDNIAFVNLMKRVSPEIPIIATSSFADSETVIKLINESRVFRVAFTPFNTTTLGLYIKSAIRSFHAVAAQPALVQTQRPASISGQRSGDFLQKFPAIATRLSRFKDRFFNG